MVRARVALVLALLVATLHASGAQERSGQEQGALLLARYTLLALDQANKSGNYGVLRDLGAPAFRKANTPARLAEVFARHRRSGLDLAAAAVLEPVWREPPSRDAQGMLHLAGAYRSERVTTQFELAFERAGTGWQLAGLSVALVPTKTAAALDDIGLRR